MKYIKNFNEENIKSIEDWCEHFGLNRFVINEDNTVDVIEYAYLVGFELENIPIQFRIAYSSFYCYNNKLTSLKGCPEVVREHFSCSNNKITTLQYCPKRVDFDFSCRSNYLTNLGFVQEIINGSFVCNSNKLTSLKGSPKEVGGDFICNNNKITSLEDGPIKVGGYYNVSYNKLTTIKMDSLKVNGDFYCSHNNLISLDGILDRFNNSRGSLEFIWSNNPIYNLYAAFGDMDFLINSLDYNYLRGDKIVKHRFEEACEEAGIKMPEYIDGYKYI